MKFKLSRQCAKDIERINNKKVLVKISHVLDLIEHCEHIQELPNTLELEGFDGYFRIKFDYHYRLGCYLTRDNVLELKRCLSREMFYNKFP